MVEFSREKIKPRRSPKLFEHIQIYIYIRLKGQLGKQKSPIANHATTLCKECEIKPLTTQALSQLLITQSLLFPILTVSG